ncbi:MAG: 50S ribosomal protein L7/L12 [Pedobacter sp.]|nr:MAG: 50S ribosomal protein L7/L12 [Pedobacter sp.]
MSTKTEIIIENLKQLTLLETNELIGEIERIFGVDATAITAPMIMANSGNSTPAPIRTEIIEEKTSFDVILNEFAPDQKVNVLKVIRTITGLGLKECKEIVDNLPKMVKEGLSKEESENIKKELENAGAKVTLK